MTKEIKNYAQSNMFEKLFNDAAEIVENASKYLENNNVNSFHALSLQEQSKIVSMSVVVTDALMQVCEFVLSLKAYSKNEIDTLKNVNFKTYTMEADPSYPTEFNMILTQSKHLYDRVIRIDNQLKNNIVGM